LGNKEVWAEHFCATCYLEFNEIVPHQEVRDCQRYRYKAPSYNQGPPPPGPGYN
jgi:hypothetical protein